MTQFLGTHQNRLDAKGRVSIPASFRAALRNGTEANEAKLILRSSHKYPCIEGWPPALFAQLEAPMQDFDLFSEEQDDLAMALYPDAYELEFDKEGRTLLPADLIAHANLTDSVVFLGLGRVFHIWEPAAAARRRVEGRERARARNMTLRVRDAS